MSESLTNLGSEQIKATEQKNTTGTMSTVLSWSPIDGLLLRVINQADGGQGIPIYAELRDADGNDLSKDTNLVLRWKTPSEAQPQNVSEQISNIRPWRTLTLEQQQSTEYQDQIRVNLGGPAVEVMDFETLQLAIESPDRIDWSHSRVEIDRDAVEVVAEG